MKNNNSLLDRLIIRVLKENNLFKLYKYRINLNNSKYFSQMNDDELSTVTLDNILYECLYGSNIPFKRPLPINKFPFYRISHQLNSLIFTEIMNDWIMLLRQHRKMKQFQLVLKKYMGMTLHEYIKFVKINGISVFSLIRNILPLSLFCETYAQKAQWNEFNHQYLNMLLTKLL